MDDIETLKKFWRPQPATTLLDVAGIQSAVEKYRSKKRRNMLWLLIALIICLCTIVLIFIKQQTSFMTSKIGEACTVAGFVIGIIYKLRRIFKTKQSEFLSNKDYLKQIEHSLSKKHSLNLLQVCAVLFMSVGYALYLYEFIHNNKILMVLVYAGWFVFIALICFISRKYSIKKSDRKKAKLLENISRIQSQIME